MVEQTLSRREQVEEYLKASAPPHPYQSYTHCWRCRVRIAQIFRAETKSRKQLGQRSRLAVFTQIHEALLAAPSAPQAINGGEDNPEATRNLWVSVLERAILDLAGPQWVARAARQWFLSNDSTTGSFVWVCHHLQIEEEAVRAKVLKLSATEIRNRLGRTQESPDDSERRRSEIPAAQAMTL